MAGMDIFLICDENEHARVCRVCLIRDVRMYDLQSYPLETNFEAIIGISVMCCSGEEVLIVPGTLSDRAGHFVQHSSKLWKVRKTEDQEQGDEEDETDKPEPPPSIKEALEAAKLLEKYFLYNQDASILLDMNKIKEGMTLHKVKEECTNIDDFEITVDCIKEEDDFMGDVDLDVGHSSDEPLSVHKVVSTLCYD
ncbi:putative zinc finger, MYM domain containing 1 [Operophtera brumata]|uniref:Putative zinc finger, MYM domain containing 1 n=1 Tax=Operophtera brumata TaxID=104452 RepID=A0A0L7KWM0_OPEBR|nr:putative zinc finger, MYM domain containing 1 [Operophtera brumata]